MRPLVVSFAMASLVSVQATAVERGTLPPRYQVIAAAQCLRDLDSFDRTLHESGFGVVAPESRSPFVPRGYFEPTGTPRQQIRILRNGAYNLAMQGNEAQCQEILVTMRDLYRRHQQAVEAQQANPQRRTRWRRAHLARAHPLAAMCAPVPATALIGADLRNKADERLGEIADVVLDPTSGSVALVLVARGGLLGLGTDLVAVRWQDLRATEDHETFVLDVPGSLFQSAPTVDERSFGETVRGPWRHTVDRFWDNALTNQGRER